MSVDLDELERLWRLVQDSETVAQRFGRLEVFRIQLSNAAPALFAELRELRAKFEKSQALNTDFFKTEYGVAHQLRRLEAERDSLRAEVERLKGQLATAHDAAIEDFLVECPCCGEGFNASSNILKKNPDGTVREGTK